MRCAHVLHIHLFIFNVTYVGSFRIYIWELSGGSWKTPHPPTRGCQNPRVSTPAHGGCGGFCIYIWGLSGDLGTRGSMSNWRGLARSREGAERRSGGGQKGLLNNKIDVLMPKRARDENKKKIPREIVAFFRREWP